MKNYMYNLNSIIGIAVSLLFITPILALAQSTAYVTTTDASADVTGIGSGTALNWAGYVSEKATYTSVSGSWIVPTVTDISENGADATWVGIGGVLSHDLIQTGTEAVPNSAGGIDYQAWYELLPSGSVTVPLTVSAGDSMTASIVEQSSNIWLITIADTTTGKSYSTTLDYSSSLSSAEWVEEMPAGVGTRISLDDFGTVDFTGGMTTDNGSSVSIAGSGAQALTMANETDQSLAVPSVLGSDGESFSVTRTDAQSNSIGIGTFGDGRGGFITTAGSGSQPSYGNYGSYGTGTTTQITPSITVTYGNDGTSYASNTASGRDPPSRYRMNHSYSRAYSIIGANGIIRILVNGYSRF